MGEEMLCKMSLGSGKDERNTIDDDIMTDAEEQPGTGMFKTLSAAGSLLRLK